MRKVFSANRRDVSHAKSRSALSELYKRAGNLITLCSILERKIWKHLIEIPPGFGSSRKCSKHSLLYQPVEFACKVSQYIAECLVANMPPFIPKDYTYHE